MQPNWLIDQMLANHWDSGCMSMQNICMYVCVIWR